MRLPKTSPESATTGNSEANGGRIQHRSFRRVAEDCFVLGTHMIKEEIAYSWMCYADQSLESVSSSLSLSRTELGICFLHLNCVSFDGATKIRREHSFGYFNYFLFSAYYFALHDLQFKFSVMYVVKRDGWTETVHFDKITARLNKPSYGLSHEHCDPVLVAQKVCAGVYMDVTSSQLDELAAETAATLRAS
ncbi:Ribonucleoside-diphosphate reductase large subunit [Hordeum vulgare]|nr:Ribonucleoside-diphosphate reductase large subunit [Hordeum vulgare]